MSDGLLSRAVFLALGQRPDVDLYRNNVGMGWVGSNRDARPVSKRVTGVTLEPGDIVLRQARPLHAGLFKGSDDYIGRLRHVIRPEDVGRTCAVFLGVEVKDGSGRSSLDQRRWRALTLAAGGISGEVRSVEQAHALCRWPPLL